MIFVSYSYDGRIGTEYYSGFGNCFLKGKEPASRIEWEKFAARVETRALATQGMDTITCVVLYYKEMKRGFALL